MRWRRGDAVTARRPIEGIDVPLVPAGSRGWVSATTLFGRPKQVSFVVADGWGLKEFRIDVGPGDVEWFGREH